jgi:hypothetical protein
MMDKSTEIIAHLKCLEDYVMEMVSVTENKKYKDILNHINKIDILLSDEYEKNKLVKNFNLKEII